MDESLDRFGRVNGLLSRCGSCASGRSVGFGRRHPQAAWRRLYVRRRASQGPAAWTLHSDGRRAGQIVQEGEGQPAQSGRQGRGVDQARTAVRYAADVEALTLAERIALSPAPRQACDPAILRTLCAALLAMKQVRFTYCPSGDGAAALRTVDPCGLLFGSVYYLVAR